MNILVVSSAAWNKQNNDGNTLDNIFTFFNNDRFANIYFSEGIPGNNKCDLYLQYTDNMILNHLLKGKSVNRIYRGLNTDFVISSFEEKGKARKSDLLILLREFAWKCCNLNNENLRQFIKEFKPDIIFFPTYGSLRLLRFTLVLKKMCNIPIVGYISDDLYSYKRGMSFLGKFNHFFVRRALRKVFDSYDLIYTMTTEQQQEIKMDFSRDALILRKNIVSLNPIRKKHSPLKFIYAGGLYFGRDSIIKRLEESIEKISKRVGYKWGVIDVFSQNTSSLLKNSMYLNIHQSISYDELVTVYKEYDVSLVVESFDEVYIEITKLSFSTKILDCLQSGCAIVALGPKENAGIKYLKLNNAAIVINDESTVENKLNELNDFYSQFQLNARDCALLNHDGKKNTLKFRTELLNLLKEKNKKL